ncbi:hypothetical protein [Tessaracoccus caeni]|uniref:hypothetical protein n=1 Tax=Tessaracoccus caeni TaxID=3031239 RepID=UPI0023DCD909|nr:hypothetical protein [Tessaracoccus caeni]MDF1486827.1 hypothetical protein [Tessaracoccus caeni]
MPKSWDEAMAGASFDDLVERARRDEREQAEKKVEAGLLASDRELDVPMVRVVSSSEWAQAIVGCLAEAGFSAEGFADGSLNVDDVPPEQGEALNYAAYRCNMQYPINPYQQMALPEESAQLLYQHWVEVSMPCLEQQGVQVTGPPSEQTWLDAWALGSESAWSPYTSVDASPDAAYRDGVYQACPREPEGLYPSVPQ